MLKHSIIFISCALCVSSYAQQSSAPTPNISKEVETYRIEQKTQNHTQSAPRQGAPFQDKIEYLEEVIFMSEEKFPHQAQMEAFWAERIHQPVDSETFTEFSSYVWEFYQKKGYLTYLSFDRRTTENGSKLLIYLTLPTIQDISISSDEESASLSAIVEERFRRSYPKGSPIDLQGFENHLDSIAYDLPIELDISLTQISEKQVNAEIAIRKIKHQPLSFQSGFSQFNNFGIKDYGTNQFYLSGEFQGLTPLSKLNIGSQISSGIKFGKIEYEAPFVGTQSKWRAYALRSESDTQTTSGTPVAGLTNEVGLGVYRLIHTTRNTKWIAGAEISSRATQSQLGGLNTSDRADKQIRYKLSSETRQWLVNYIGNEITFSTGSMNLNKNASDKTSDETSGAFVHGQYKKLEMAGGLIHNFDKSNFSFSTNWKGQTASKNMDAYNRFSAGGAGGMRGFSSLDGVSDRGGILLFNLNYRINEHFNAGLLYDVGRIRTTNLTTEKIYYTLQNAGVQVSGKMVGKALWNITAAKVIGSVPDSAHWTSANSKPGDWRVGASLSIPF